MRSVSITFVYSRKGLPDAGFCTTNCRNESFYDVSVHSRGLGDSVRAALQRHWEPTHFSGTDKVMCEKCGHKEDAVRTMTPQQLPKVLVVLLRPPATCEVSAILPSYVLVSFSVSPSQRAC